MLLKIPISNIKKKKKKKREVFSLSFSSNNEIATLLPLPPTKPVTLVPLSRAVQSSLSLARHIQQPPSLPLAWRSQPPSSHIRQSQNRFVLLHFQLQYARFCQYGRLQYYYMVFNFIRFVC